MAEHPVSQNATDEQKVQSVGFDQINQFYVEKYIDALNNMVGDNDPVMKLNCALRDNDQKKAAALKALLPQEILCPLRLASETIVNKSRMRIAFLAAYSEHPQKASLFYKLSDQAVALGHDVLLFSHACVPVGLSSRATFFLAHPQSSLSGIVPAVDAVIAENWSLAAEALRINAPLKFFLADYSLMRYPFWDERKRSAVQKAYSLPMRILTYSSMLSKTASTLFQRDAAVLPVPALSNAVQHQEVEEAPLRLLIAANGDGTTNYLDALSALCYLKANGIEYRIASALCADDGEHSAYDLEIQQHTRPSESEMLTLLQDTDVYLDLSCDDFLSYQIIHAMKCGCVAILPKGSGSLMNLNSGENCILYDPIKPPGLAGVLQSIAQQRGLRHSIAQNSRRLAKRHTTKALAKSLQKELGATVLQSVRD